MKNLHFEIENPPPSVNGCWRHAGKRTYITKNYQNWKNHIRWYLKSLFNLEEGTTIIGDGLFEMEIILEFKSKRKRDLDNYLKPLLDTLEGYIFDDDSQLIKLIVYKKIQQDNDCVKVTILY